MTNAINTGKVAGRRELRFATLADVRAEVDRLAAAEDVRTLGNWSAGQVLRHVAIVMEKSLDGFTERPPWFIGLMVRLFFKRRFLNGRMPAGFKLPKAAEAELVPGETTLAEGLASLRRALDRLAAEPRRAPNPVLGPLTADEWERLHCRHSEMHLSFLLPVDGRPAEPA